MDYRNAVISWLQLSFEIKKDATIEKNQVYTYYLQWCQQTGLRVTSPAAFGRMVKQAFPERKCCKKGTKENTEHHYKHLKVRDGISLSGSVPMAQLGGGSAYSSIGYPATLLPHQRMMLPAAQPATHNYRSHQNHNYHHNHYATHHTTLNNTSNPYTTVSRTSFPPPATTNINSSSSSYPSNTPYSRQYTPLPLPDKTANNYFSNASSSSTFSKLPYSTASANSSNNVVGSEMSSYSSRSSLLQTATSTAREHSTPSSTMPPLSINSTFSNQTTSLPPPQTRRVPSLSDKQRDYGGGGDRSQPATTTTANSSSMDTISAFYSSLHPHPTLYAFSNTPGTSSTPPPPSTTTVAASPPPRRASSAKPSSFSSDTYSAASSPSSSPHAASNYQFRPIHPNKEGRRLNSSTSCLPEIRSSSFVATSTARLSPTYSSPSPSSYPSRSSPMATTAANNFNTNSMMMTSFTDIQSQFRQRAADGDDSFGSSSGRMGKPQSYSAASSSPPLQQPSLSPPRSRPPPPSQRYLPPMPSAGAPPLPLSSSLLPPASGPVASTTATATCSLFELEDSPGVKGEAGEEEEEEEEDPRRWPDDRKSAKHFQQPHQQQQHDAAPIQLLTESERRGLKRLRYEMLAGERADARSNFNNSGMMLDNRRPSRIDTVHKSRSMPLPLPLSRGQPPDTFTSISSPSLGSASYLLQPPQPAPPSADELLTWQAQQKQHQAEKEEAASLSVVTPPLSPTPSEALRSGLTLSCHRQDVGQHEDSSAPNATVDPIRPPAASPRGSAPLTTGRRPSEDDSTRNDKQLQSPKRNRGEVPLNPSTEQDRPPVSSEDYEEGYGGGDDGDAYPDDSSLLPPELIIQEEEENEYEEEGREEYPPPSCDGGTSIGATAEDIEDSDKVEDVDEAEVRKLLELVNRSSSAKDEARTRNSSPPTVCFTSEERGWGLYKKFQRFIF